MKHYDVIIIGAGAAGIFSAISAIQRGRCVAILDMGPAPLRKVSVSGGGRCNFTNLAVAYNRYFGENPNFTRSAITQFSPQDMLDWVRKHNIDITEKAPGQYFCMNGAETITTALIQDTQNADFYQNTTVTNITKDGQRFSVTTSGDLFTSESVIIATGGTSFANLGVSDIGHKIAKQFGHKIIPVRPALCAIATDIFSSELAGISMSVEITVGREKFTDSILFTHFGIGGPAIYRTTVRNISNGIHINLMPEIDIYSLLRESKKQHGKRNLSSVLGQYMPNRVAQWIVNGTTKNIADYKDSELQQIANRISDIFLSHDKIKLHNLQSAEVVRGGVSTDMISSKTMESKICSGLFLVGEVLDIAGDLGGFNLHWAWASGYVAGQNA